jgi:chaperonin GroES
MKVRMLDKKVLVKIIAETETKSEGGIIIPDNAKEKPERGIVMEISDHPCPVVNKGDKILFGKYNGTMVKLANEEYLILDIDDIMMVIVEEEEKKL